MTDQESTLYTPTCARFVNISTEVDTMHMECRSAAESLKAALDGPVDALLSLRRTADDDPLYEQIHQCSCALAHQISQLDIAARRFYVLLRQYAEKRGAYEPE